MSLLVNDLLTLSRADAGGFTFAFASCDLVDITQQSVSAHIARAKQAGIHLLFIPFQQPLPLCADPFRLRQAIDNLLDNALRYAPTGSTVKAGVRIEEEAVFFVQDEGSGLSEQEIAHVFDRSIVPIPHAHAILVGLGLDWQLQRQSQKRTRVKCRLKVYPDKAPCSLSGFL